MPEFDKPHISSNFDHSLRALHDSMLMMSALVERSLVNAQAGLLQDDSGRCNQVIADDEEIDALEWQINRDVMGVILRFQPVSLDLRVVVATLKICVNLERIADNAVDIARRARKLSGHAPLPDSPALASIFQDCVKFQRQVIEAFAKREALSPNYIENVRTALVGRVQEYSDEAAQSYSSGQGSAVNVSMELVHIARLLEQVVDICRDIGSDTQFAFNPEYSRHTGEDAWPGSV